MQRTFTFKQLVMLIHNVHSEAGFDGVLADINASFEAGRITFNDHEVLYDIACLAYKGRRGGKPDRYI